MSVVRKNVTFAASEVKANLLTGLVEEFLSRPSAIRLYATQSLADEVELDVQVGNVSIAKDVTPPPKTIGILARNEDLLITTVGAPGDRLQIRGQSGATGGTLTYMVEISELG